MAHRNQQQSKVDTIDTIDDEIACKVFIGAYVSLRPLEGSIRTYLEQSTKVLFLNFPDKKDTWGYAIVEDPEAARNLYRKRLHDIDGAKVEMKHWELSRWKDLDYEEVRKYKAVVQDWRAVSVETIDLKPFVEPGKSIDFKIRIRSRVVAPRKFTKIETPTHREQVQFISVKPPGSKFVVLTEQSPRHDVSAHVVDILVKDPELDKLLPSSMYVEREEEEIKRRIIPAFPPQRRSKTHHHTNAETIFTETLDEYPIPQGTQKDVDLQGRSVSLNPWKTRENYQARAHALLHVEEAEQTKLMRRYNMYDVMMEYVEKYTIGNSVCYPSKKEPVLRVQVPGLSESRPSVLYGDSIYAWIPGTVDVEYEGWVDVVETNSILCMFHPVFHERVWNPSAKFNVRFSFPRIQLRYMHRALDRINWQVVWPDDPRIEKVLAQKPPVKFPIDTIQLFDRQIDMNKEQLNAVAVALNRHYMPEKVPLLITGPFGCGKTKVLCEIVLQVIKNIPEARLLICSHVNTAADVFAKMLVASPDFRSKGAAKLLRLYAMNRHKKQVPEQILPYTRFDSENEIFVIPIVEELKGFNIIVTTTITSNYLFGMGIGDNFFTHIIIDEAAQMMEAEAYIPLCLANLKTTIILAGDEKQLGPRIQSSSVKHHRLAESMVERLKKFAPYTERNDCLISLVQNYRCNPRILEFPSQQFYGGNLKAMADKSIANKLLEWRKLRNKKFPVMFWSVSGEDYTEHDSPSWYNPYEITEVVKLVEDLLRDPSNKLKDSDVCVCSPFWKQRAKIRDQLRANDRRDVVVCSVDELQGKEFSALFISTVRSSRKWEREHDRLFSAGFLNNERMLNTAITRAMSLLVVVGDSFVLGLDGHWRAFLDYCIKNDSYVGDRLTPEIEKARLAAESRRLAPAPTTQGSTQRRNGAILSISSQSTGQYEGREEEEEEEEVEMPEEPVDEEDPDKTVTNSALGLGHLYQNEPQPVHRDKNGLSESNASSSHGENPIVAQLMAQASLRLTAPVASPNGAVQHSPPVINQHNSSAGYSSLYRWGQSDLVFSRGVTSSPPFMVIDRQQCLDVEICSFGGTPHILQQDNVFVVQISYRPAGSDSAGYSVLVNSMAPREHVSELCVQVPAIEFNSNTVEAFESRGLLMLRLPRKQAPAQQWQPLQITQIPPQQRQMAIKK